MGCDFQDDCADYFGADDAVDYPISSWELEVERLVMDVGKEIFVRVR